MMDIQVVILCGGKGTRLESMDLPKPLCSIRGKSLIYHVLEGLPKEINNVTFFYTENLDKVQFERTIIHSCNGLQKFQFQKISIETRGPVETAYVGLHKGIFDINKPILFIDNDTVNLFSLSNINKDYLGIGTFQTQDTGKPYSFLQINSDKKVINIKEKEGISNIYSTGLYYFPTVKLFKELCDNLFDVFPNKSEYFISDLYSHAIENKKVVYTFPCESSIALGTHSDILENIHKVKNYPMRICFDIDNTILTYSNNIGTTEGITEINNICNLIRKLHTDGHTIVLNTARGMKSCNSNIGKVGKKSMINVIQTLDDLNIPYDELYFGKPWADIYIDDKAWNQYTNPSFSDFLFNYREDKSILHLQKNCSNNENVLWHRDNKLVKEGPISSLEGEIYFYKKIHNTSLEYISPKYYSDSQIVNRSYLTLEFLNGYSVSRLFRNGLLNKQILTTVINIIQKMHESSIESDNTITKEDILSNYLGKLNERVQSHPNYNLYKINEVIKIINKYIPEYINSDDFKITDIVHGDPWFDNMIYDYKEQNVKLLDMKGKVGSMLSLKGDKMVDYAKLYQSVLGFDYYLNNEIYDTGYEAKCREWLEELLPFPITDIYFEVITACCILKTFSYFSKTEPILPIYKSLGKLKIFSNILN